MSTLVGNLDFKATEECIRRLFEQFGPVEDVRVVVDPESGKARGLALVEMSSDADAARAIAFAKGQSKETRLEGPALSISYTVLNQREQQQAHSEVDIAGTERQTVDLEGIVGVTGRAIQVFGDRETAMRWLRTPLPSLSNKTPLSMLKTPEGIGRVEDILGRIEHGVW